MNEHNHHRILERLARFATIKKEELEVLKKASNFTDSIWSFWDYYYFHFFYSIRIKENKTIQLFREDSKDGVIKKFQEYSEAIVKFSQLYGIENNLTKSAEISLDFLYDVQTKEFIKEGNKKEFFSSVNNRMKSFKEDILDIGNQSDNVAFLHAMAAEDEDKNNTKKEFKNHLKKCFREYLFLKDDLKALYMLGIALHGIMDSFTPSHTDFQKYTTQDMAFHAQGDVLPEDVPFFEPGQYSKEGMIAKILFKALKGYDNNEIINETEFLMLKIFFIIGDISNKSDRRRRTVNEKTGLVDMGIVERFLQEFKGKKLSEINETLREKYIYGPTAYVYENHAMWAMNNIYKKLRDKRRNLSNNYEAYNNIEVDVFIDNCIGEWEEIYEHMHNDKEFKAKNILLKHYFEKRPLVPQTLTKEILDIIKQQWKNQK